MAEIENIILDKDTRNISKLKKYIDKDFVNKSAEFLLESKGNIFITTGFYIVYAGATETDGPPGSVALGNALKKLGFSITYITDKWSYDVVKSILQDEDELIEFPITSHIESLEFGNKLIKDFSPELLISIERAGLMNDGTYRNWKNEDISEFNAKIDHLFEQFPKSIGIGDGGNEIGMGNLYNEIIETSGLPDNPSITTVSNLIISSCSNWGAYGLIAAISKLIGENLLPSVDLSKEYIMKLVDSGAVEGMSGKKYYGVDGRNLDDDSSCLQRLHDHLKNHGL